MRKALPVITADAQTLKPHLQRAYDGRQRPRLQRLDLLASGQAHTRQEVAQLLGVHRQTIGHWLTISDSAGLDVLLALDVPAGKPLSLPPEVLAAIGQARQQPRGFASYEALRQWVKQPPHLEVNYHTLYTLVRPQLKAKRKVPRPSPTKNP